MKKGKDRDGVYTNMTSSENVLEVINLHTYFNTDEGIVKAVEGVSFDVPKGKIVALVGESGCGKSMTSLSVMGLVPSSNGKIERGEIHFDTGDTVLELTKLSPRAMERIRGNSMSMIFQEPMTSLNPVFTVGKQIEEVVRLHSKELNKEMLRKRVLQILDSVGIGRAEGVYKQYPHELSGGMRQRIMIGMAIACSPKLIIADEPTTALDVTIQAQILELLRDLREKMSTSILLITHDLGIVAMLADYVVVMYAGRVVEKGTAREIFKTPAHPYTIGLLKSRPIIGQESDELFSITGQVPNPINMPKHCYYKERCSSINCQCEDYPEQKILSDTHQVACHMPIN